MCKKVDKLKRGCHFHDTLSIQNTLQYVALPDGAGRFPQDFSGPAVLRISRLYGHTDIHDIHGIATQSYNPPTEVRVWAFSLSLATTWEITIVFCSSRYLDVSVPWVPHTPRMFGSAKCLKSKKIIKHNRYVKEHFWAYSYRAQQNTPL